jgi:hypothetical protein
MIRRTTYAVFLVLAIAGASVTAAVGDSSLHPFAYGLALLVGVVVYFQATKRLVDEAIGTTLLGVLGGLLLSEVVLTAVSAYVIGSPIDLAAWQMWTFLLFPWAYVLTLVLTGYFSAGLVDMLR